MTDREVVWTGVDGTNYAYKVFSPDVGWNDVPGNYIFAKRVGGQWRPLYIGETKSLKIRFKNGHEKWQAAKRRGASHVHAHTSNAAKSVRTREEENLIDNYTPPLNDQRAT